MAEFSKENLVSDIKTWIALDDEISKYRKIVRDLNNKKKNTTTKLIKTMKTTEVDCFDLNSGGSLMFNQTKSKKPVTAKLLNNVLLNIYKDQTQVDKILQEVQDNREEVVRETICRKKI